MIYFVSFITATCALYGLFLFGAYYEKKEKKTGIKALIHLVVAMIGMIIINEGM